MAVVIFVFGAIVLVLAIILALLFFKKRRSAAAKNRKSFIPRLERQRGGQYGKLEEDGLVSEFRLEDAAVGVSF